MKIVAALTALSLTLAASYAAYAASPVAEKAVADRKGNLKEIGGAFKTINDELKTGSPDFNSVRPAARNIADRAPFLLKMFPKGSGPESGVKTRAKPEIWTNNAAFVKLQNDMVAAARSLNAAAIKGDVAALTAARTSLGGTCKSCHDQFRDPG